MPGSQTTSQHCRVATCVSAQRPKVRDTDRKCKSHSHDSCQEQGEQWSENVYSQLAPSSAQENTLPEWTPVVFAHPAARPGSGNSLSKLPWGAAPSLLPRLQGAGAQQPSSERARGPGLGLGRPRGRSEDGWWPDWGQQQPGPDAGKDDGEREGVFPLGLLSGRPSCPLRRVAARGHGHPRGQWGGEGGAGEGTRRGGGEPTGESAGSSQPRGPAVSETAGSSCVSQEMSLLCASARLSWGSIRRH